MNELEFTTKEEYLQFVADWKIRYKELSEDIRELKDGIKTIQRTIYRCYGNFIRYIPDEKVLKDIAGKWGDKYLSDLDYRKITAKREATYELQVRKASKILAQEQYLAAKEKVS